MKIVNKIYVIFSSKLMNFVILQMCLFISVYLFFSMHFIQSMVRSCQLYVLLIKYLDEKLQNFIGTY